MTNKHHGNEFIDNPKTLGIAIACPVSLDDEIGPYSYGKIMEGGHFCRVLADHFVDVEVHLRPTDWIMPIDDMSSDDKDEILADISTPPQAVRTLELSEHFKDVDDYRPFAVCTVQTFRNPHSGPMLYLFVDYYYRMGWRVIIYDRFGFHQEYLESFIGLSGIDYHPYTVFQLVNPNKYNDEFAKKQGFDLKYFYKMEKNWGYGGKEADTADQDADKTHTYDHSRVEYMHLPLVLYIDSDEFFYCPHAEGSLKRQKKYHARLMGNIIYYFI